MEQVVSVSNVPVRITEERWLHIVENHIEMAGHYYDILDVIAKPEIVVEGFEGEQIALRKKRDKSYWVVVYKEVSGDDGFIITAFFTSKIKKLLRRKIVWKQESP